MPPAKSISVEKRITRSAARTILNEKSDQTFPLLIHTESQTNDHVSDTKRKGTKKARSDPATSELESGMCIATAWNLYRWTLSISFLVHS